MFILSSTLIFTFSFLYFLGDFQWCTHANAIQYLGLRLWIWNKINRLWDEKQRTFTSVCNFFPREPPPPSTRRRGLYNLHCSLCLMRDRCGWLMEIPTAVHVLLQLFVTLPSFNLFWHLLTNCTTIWESLNYSALFYCINLFAISRCFVQCTKQSSFCL